MADPLTLLVLTATLSLAAAYLMRPKQKSLARDDKPTTLTERGAFVPYVLGRRRVGAIFAWAGDRYTHSEKVSGGGGKGGGGSSKSQKQDIYFESAWHQLCVGPAFRLHKIIADGKVIFSGPINSTTTPSGSTIDLGGNGSFRIYWGEHNQPVNTRLASGDFHGFGIASRWPFLCYIHWLNKRLGTSPRWPLIDYDIETRVMETAESPSGSPWIGTGDDDAGVNPAHAVAQLLFGKYPGGMELDPADFDLQSLDDLSTIVEAEGIPVSVFAQDGQDAAATLGSLMQDLSFMISWDPTAGKYIFRAIRQEPAENVTAVDPDLLLPPLPEVEVNHDERPVDKMVFAFSDRARDFRDMTITVDDDAQGDFLQHQKTRKIDMPNITSFDVATKIAERRFQEELAGGGVIKFVMNRAARVFVPGHAITVPGFPGTYRVERTEIDALSGQVTVYAIADIFGTPATDFTPGNGSGLAPVPQPPVADLAFTFIEVPSHISPGVQQVVVPRIRDNGQIVGADIWFSRDGVTYSHVGDDSGIFTGGTLDAEFSAATPTLVEQGPTITAIGPDIDTVLDLSGDAANWRGGRQLAIIDDEIFYLQKVTALGGDQYRLDGLIRARFDTPKATHAANAKVYIFQDDVFRIEDLLLVPNAALYVKTQPRTGQSLALSLVTPVNRTLTGKGIGPMPMANLRTDNMSNSYVAGQDIPLRWNYRSAATARTGAGLQLSGSPVGVSAPEGVFTLRIKAVDGTLKREITNLVTSSHTYTNTQLVADFLGVEPSSFKVTIENVNAGLKSPTLEITVVKV